MFSAQVGSTLTPSLSQYCSAFPPINSDDVKGLKCIPRGHSHTVGAWMAFPHFHSSDDRHLWESSLKAECVGIPSDAWWGGNLLMEEWANRWKWTSWGRQGFWRESLQDAKVRAQEWTTDIIPGTWVRGSWDTMLWGQRWQSGHCVEVMVFKEVLLATQTHEVPKLSPSLLAASLRRVNVLLYLFPSSTPHFLLLHLVPPELKVCFCIWSCTYCLKPKICLWSKVWVYCDVWTGRFWFNFCEHPPLMIMERRGGVSQPSVRTKHT